MKRIHILIPATAIALATFISACSSAPKSELEDAQAALDSARTAEADLYAVDLYRSAEDSFRAAEHEIAKQDSSGTLSRNYDRAEELLVFVREQALEAALLADSARENVRIENEALFVEADSALARLNALPIELTQGRATVVPVDQRATDAALLLSEARSAQAEGDYALAKDRAHAALARVNELLSSYGMTTPAPSPRS